MQHIHTKKEINIQITLLLGFRYNVYFALFKNPAYVQNWFSFHSGQFLHFTAVKGLLSDDHSIIVSPLVLLSIRHVKFSHWKTMNCLLTTWTQRLEKKSSQDPAEIYCSKKRFSSSLNRTTIRERKNRVAACALQCAICACVGRSVYLLHCVGRWVSVLTNRLGGYFILGLNGIIKICCFHEGRNHYCIKRGDEKQLPNNSFVSRWKGL